MFVPNVCGNGRMRPALRWVESISGLPYMYAQCTVERTSPIEYIICYKISKIG